MRIASRQGSGAAAEGPERRRRTARSSFLSREERRHAGGRKSQKRRCGEPDQRSGLPADRASREAGTVRIGGRVVAKRNGLRARGTVGLPPRPARSSSQASRRRPSQSAVISGAAAGATCFASPSGRSSDVAADVAVTSAAVQYARVRGGLGSANNPPRPLASW